LSAYCDANGQIDSDLSLTIPAAAHPDGRVLFLDLPYTGSALAHSWVLGDETQWDGGVLDNVTVEGSKMVRGQMCEVIKLKQIAGVDGTFTAECLLQPDGTLLLVSAQKQED